MIRKLFQDNKPLIVAGILSLVFAGICVTLVLSDPTEILGINRWIKPAKFFISITIFLWTIAIFLEHLPASDRVKSTLSWSMILIFAIEMAVIVGQPLRGRTSHFNVGSPFDGAVFATMGIAIAVLTLIVIYLTFLYFISDIRLPRSIAWGIRFGLLMMVLASFQGAYMSQHLSHAVGVPDGGAGLPLVNWSTEGGDLRVAHFLGMHGLQAIPLAAIFFDWISRRWSLLATIVFAAIYAGLFSAVFVQALLGRPFAAI